MTVKTDKLLLNRDKSVSSRPWKICRKPNFIDDLYCHTREDIYINICIYRYVLYFFNKKYIFAFLKSSDITVTKEDG